MFKEYRTIGEIYSPLMIIKNVEGITYEELGEVGLNTLVRGQKLPIFSGAGLPPNQLAVRIARQARVLKKEEKFAFVFAAMGITFKEAEYFICDFKKTGALSRTILFINLADDPPIERIALPCVSSSE